MDPTLDNQLLREIIARTEAEEDRNNPMFPRGGTDEIDRHIEASEFNVWPEDD